MGERGQHREKPCTGGVNRCRASDAQFTETTKWQSWQLQPINTATTQRCHQHCSMNRESPAGEDGASSQREYGIYGGREPRLMNTRKAGMFQASAASTVSRSRRPLL